MCALQTLSFSALDKLACPSPCIILGAGGSYKFLPLVENIAKKNHNHFSIAVLLTTSICSRLNDYICFFGLPT